MSRQQFKDTHGWCSSGTTRYGTPVKDHPRLRIESYWYRASHDDIDAPGSNDHTL
jgi:hypothetical protein